MAAAALPGGQHEALLQRAALLVSPSHAALAAGVQMDARVILLCLLLAACSTPDVERSFRECIGMDRDAIYTVAGDLKKVECRR